MEIVSESVVGILEMSNINAGLQDIREFWW